MLAFACPVCEHLLTFESVHCLHCGSDLGFDPTCGAMGKVSGGGDGHSVRCINAKLAACNWLVESEGELCLSCRLTRTRPNDADQPGLGGFAAAETAKRRLLFELSDLGLPIESWREREGGLAFDLLSSEQARVTTGQADGVITLDLHETDPAHRERMRLRMGEPYRTVLGHFRHEIGHYYQPILIEQGSAEEAHCREVFGDDREDYSEAMDRYYETGAPVGWEQSFVSAYATMHPWEDWAETFAHYLHIRDTSQTAAAYGVRVAGPTLPTADVAPLRAMPRETIAETSAMLDAWIPLTYALNAISRSMGESDLYPFVLSPAVKAKLEFIGDLVLGATGASV
jgi:hypothetical protein